MAKDIKKSSVSMEPIQFHHFEFVTEEQINKIIHDIPKKYEKKVGSSFLKEQSKADFGSDSSSKSYKKQGVEPMYGPKY